MFLIEGISSDGVALFRVVYFPSYELLVDDLRDYRFYAEDMLHPSPLVPFSAPVAPASPLAASSGGRRDARQRGRSSAASRRPRRSAALAGRALRATASKCIMLTVYFVLWNACGWESGLDLARCGVVSLCRAGAPCGLCHWGAAGAPCSSRLAMLSCPETPCLPQALLRSFSRRQGKKSAGDEVGAKCDGGRVDIARRAEARRAGRRLHAREWTT